MLLNLCSGKTTGCKISLTKSNFEYRKVGGVTAIVWSIIKDVSHDPQTLVIQICNVKCVMLTYLLVFAFISF